jgi:hypothetical protein
MRLTALRRPTPASLAFEILETRALMTAPTATFVSAVANGTALFVNIDYHADQGLNTSTLGAGDIVLSAAGRPDLVANLFTQPSTLPNGDTRAIYIVNAFSGAWNYTHTGTYSVTSPAGQVQDSQGANLQFSGIASLWLWFSTPKAQITSTTVNATDWLITVNYTDDTGIDTNSIDGNDLVITGPGLFPGLTRQSVTINSPTNVTAVYRLPAPSGAWNWLHTGTYLISMQNNQVSDTADPANRIPSYNLASYWLWFDKPAAVISTYSIGERIWLIPVTYSGRSAIDPNSIGNGDIRVTGPNGYSQLGTLTNTTNNGDGTYTATYSVPARGGDWDSSDNAVYNVAVLGNRIHDVSNRFVSAGVLNSYTLWFNNPGVSMVLPATPQFHQWDIVIDFSDNRTLDVSSITSSAIHVEAPGGPINVTLLNTAAGPNGATRATFRLTSISGLPNGHYEVWTNPNQVHDTENNFVRENSIASFWFWFQ